MPPQGVKTALHTPKLGRMLRAYRKVWSLPVSDMAGVLEVSDRQLRRYERGACPPVIVLAKFVVYGTSRGASGLASQMLRAAADDARADGPATKA